MELKTLKGKVEATLKKYPRTRDSDIELTINVWRDFYGEKILKNSKGVEYISLRSLFDLPREDNIKRVRAYFQNTEGLFLPTSLEVAKKRGINERAWRIFMGYATGNPNQTSIV